MEERKWENLNMDCLVKVFEKVGMESMLLGVPFVCKSWYKATLSPLCWKTLVFPEELDIFISRLMEKYRLKKQLGVTELIKFVVSHSDGSVVSLVFSNDCPKEGLLYVANECPSLKYLELAGYSIANLVYEHGEWIDSCPLISCIFKWKELEMLKIGSSPRWTDKIITKLSLYCKKLVGLGITRANICKDEASAIVTLLPNIKHLELREAAYLPRESLVMILEGCKKLVHFDVRDCKGFEVDDEILKLASYIPTFLYEGSRMCMLESEERSSDEDTGYEDIGFCGYRSD